MRKLMVLLLLLILPAAVGASGKKHVKTSADQECSECHVDQASVWLAGAHGLMGVKCVVCHGSPEENFISKPDIARCRGCHDEEVEQVATKKAKVEKTCFPCHDPHSLVVKTAPIAPFHAKGGN